MCDLIRCACCGCPRDRHEEEMPYPCYDCECESFEIGKAAAPLSAPADDCPCYREDELGCKIHGPMAEVAPSPSPTIPDLPSSESLHLADYALNHYSGSRKDIICLAREFDKRKSSEWVKVTPATMPDEGREVEIVDIDNKRFITKRRGDFFEMNLNRVTHCWHIEDTKYWRELPSPPQENRDE